MHQLPVDADRRSNGQQARSLTWLTMLVWPDTRRRKRVLGTVVPGRPSLRDRGGVWKRACMNGIYHSSLRVALRHCSVHPQVQELTSDGLSVTRGSTSEPARDTWQGYRCVPGWKRGEGWGMSCLRGLGDPSASRPEYSQAKRNRQAGRGEEREEAAAGACNPRSISTAAISRSTSKM